jgi:hypothetical protein
VRASQALEHAAKDVSEIEKFSTSSGEGVHFKNTAKVIQLLFESHDLDSITKERCIEICMVIDTAPLTKSLSIVILGLILSDIATNDPITGTLIYVETIGGNCLFITLFHFTLHSKLISCT